MKKMYQVLLAVVLLNQILAFAQQTDASTRQSLARHNIQIRFWSALESFRSAYERPTSTGSVTDHSMNWFMAGRAFAESPQFIVDIQAYRRLLQSFMNQPEEIREVPLPSMKEQGARVALAFSLMSSPLQTAHKSASWYSPTIHNSLGHILNRDPKSFTEAECFQLGNDLAKIEAFYTWVSGNGTTFNHEGRVYMRQVRAITAKALADILLRFSHEHELDKAEITKLVQELGNFSGDFARMDASLKNLFLFRFEGVIVYDVFVNEIRTTLNSLIKNGGLDLKLFPIDRGTTVETFWKLLDEPEHKRNTELRAIDPRIAKALKAIRKIR